PRHVAERQAKAARETLAAYGYDAEIEIEVRDDGLGPGSGVVLWARSTAGHTVGGDALGERGKPAETVGREAAERLLKVLKSGASTDPHLADMAVLYMALARGRSVISTSEWTSHLETNIYIVERFLPVKFKTSTVGGRHVIEVEGVGFSRRT
ncbi:MAG: RNA 3'-terminal phosphate cyclase, partial [Pyrobaculum sp.]